MNMLSSSALDSLTINNRLVSLDNVCKVYEQNLSLFPFHIALRGGNVNMLTSNTHTNP